jgi:ribosomal protein S26
MAKKKKPVAHKHRYINKQETLECSLCGREAPKVNILESSLKRSLSKKAMLEYYSITKEQAKDFFVYMMTRF